MMLELDGRRFASGRSRYLDHLRKWPEPTAKIYLKLQIGSSKSSVMAQLDTGAAWSVLPPDVAEEARIPIESGDPTTISSRFGTKRGFLVRVPYTLVAEEGESLETDGTFFISPEWPERLSFLGYSGLLDSIRFALDPPQNHFYFGEI